MRDLDFLVLGSGTSAGIPTIGCDCDVCRSDDPRDKRLRTSAAIRFIDAQDQPRTILIDASPDLRQQVLRSGIDRCDAILFTHNHVDHTFGLDEVRRFNVTMKAPIDIYAEPHTLDHLNRVYQHIFQRERNVNDSFVATLIPHEIQPGVTLDLFGLQIEPIRLLHGRLPILGYRIEAPGLEVPNPLPLAWCTDVSSVPPESWVRLESLQTLFLDMLRERHHPTHLNLDQALDMADRIGAAQSWFIHMAHDISHQELDSRLPAGVGLAWDGQRLGSGGPSRSSSSSSEATESRS
ncbi:MAG: MBL fold metallo-hydrolase [Phycisphaerales bacterium]|nr:MBL fold metallo-hydrolase [Phycisphaerales bacterium]